MKTKKKIILDDKFHLESDSFNGLVLIFQEERIKTKEDKTEVPFIFTDKWYYPKLSMVLNKYLQLKTKEAGNVEELKEIVLRVEQTIEKL